MARQGKTATRVKRAKKAVKTAAKKVTSRLRRAQPAARKARDDGKAARPAVLKPDIPLEVLDRTYTPKQTSVKGPFRTSGDDHQRDQELAGGYVEERWNDEDRFTNKSGDPHIGTHHRKYEPGE